MLSLSCGALAPHHEDVKDSALYWGTHFVAISMCAQQNNAHRDIVEKFGDERSDQYLRLNPTLERVMEMDTSEPEDFNSLLESAEQCMEENKDTFDKFIEKLMK